jgi:hypothetical protein
VIKKLLKPSRPKSGWTPAMEEALNPILQRLTSHDEQERAAAAGVWEVVIPEVRRRLVQRLVDQLRSRSEATRRAAAESLAEAGEPAVPTLCVAFRNATSAAVRVCLAGVLGRIGCTLGPAAWMAIEIQFGHALSAARDGAVVAAVLGAMETMEPGSAAVHLARRAWADRSPDAPPTEDSSCAKRERHRSGTSRKRDRP